MMRDSLHWESETGGCGYTNPAFLRMFDYEPEKKVTGKHAAELLVPQEGRRIDDF